MLTFFGQEVLHMRLSALFGAKLFGFFEVYGVYMNKDGGVSFP